MSRLALVASGAVLVAACAAPLSAQKPTSKAKADTSVAAARKSTEAAADSAVAELGKAVSDLARQVQKVVTETANKPEVRLKAVQLAGHAVTLAQRTLEENMVDIEKMLDSTSRLLTEAETAEKARAAKKP